MNSIPSLTSSSLARQTLIATVLSELCWKDVLMRCGPRIWKSSLPSRRLVRRPALEPTCFVMMMRLCLSLTVLLSRLHEESATYFPRKAWSIIVVAKVSLHARDIFSESKLPNNNVTWPSRWYKRYSMRGSPRTGTRTGTRNFTNRSKW